MLKKEKKKKKKKMIGGMELPLVSVCTNRWGVVHGDAAGGAVTSSILDYIHLHASYHGLVYISIFPGYSCVDGSPLYK